MEKIDAQEFVNADLHGRTYEEFCNSLKMDVDISKEPTEGMIEWALLLLDMQHSPIKVGEALSNDFSMKSYDGAVLLSAPKIGSHNGSSDMKFLTSQMDLNINFFKDFDQKFMLFNDHVSLVRWSKLSNESKRHIVKPNEDAVRCQYSYATKDKWYKHSQNYKITDVFGTNLKKQKEMFIEALHEQGIEVGKDVSIGGKTYSWEGFKRKVLNYEYLLPCSNMKGWFVDEKIAKEYTTTDTYLDELSSYKMATSAQLTMHYEWFVYIKEYENSIGFKIPILPESFDDFFSLREVKKTESGRKKAIIHFVKEHYRKGTSAFSQEKNETLVRRHLRGETDFNWNGLKISLIPSMSDIINTKSKKKFINI